LKTVLNIATEQGVNKNLAFKGRHFKKPSEDSENIYLTVPEITLIHQCEITESPRLARIKDLFVVGCFTGLRFSDLSTLKPENICHLYNAKEGETIEAISLTTQKTKERVTIPMHPFVKEILQKYEGRLPKSPHKTEVNKLIKVIAHKAGITQQMEVTRNEAGKQVKVVRGKCELVTMHTARRSFATNALKSGIEAISIMKITGHRSEKAFLAYIKITSEENAVLVAANKFFKNEKQTGNLKAI
jgi:integrase